LVWAGWGVDLLADLMDVDEAVLFESELLVCTVVCPPVLVRPAVNCNAWGIENINTFI
jgi:hypothetical protein